MLDVLTPCLREKKKKKETSSVYTERERECRKKRNGAETERGVSFCTDCREEEKRGRVRNILILLQRSII